MSHEISSICWMEIFYLIYNVLLKKHIWLGLQSHILLWTSQRSVKFNIGVDETFQQHYWFCFQVFNIFNNSSVVLIISRNNEIK